MAFDSKLVKVEGLVIEALPSLLFRVKLKSGREILAHLAGKLKLYRIRVIPGDRVIVEMAGEKDERGRIIRRL